MSTLRKCLGVEARPHTLEHDGRVYTLSLVTQEKKTAFADWLFRRAARGAEVLRPVKGEEWYEARLKEINGEYLAGDYDFESDNAAKALKGKAGMVGWLAILFGVSEEEMVSLILAKGPEVRALLALVTAESMPEQGEADPNAQGPAA